MKAEICKAYGGARAIANFTFDDGLVKTAYALEELCEKYNSMASLMLTTHRLNDETAAMWNELFDKGHLRPESHSHAHMYLTNSHPENLTEEIMTKEVDGSFELLKKYFPKYDCLSFAIPYSSYAAPAMAHVKRTSYASRSGVCVLYNECARGKMQSLDPTFDNQFGSWFYPYAVRMMPEKAVYDMITPEALTDYLNRCVRDGGWFISVAHGIVEGENLDITVEDLGNIMKTAKEHADRGDLWVTDISTAIKYIRERQNTTLTVTENEDGTATVELKMADLTADNLPLDPAVFNLPLTVKISLPEGKTGASYELDGKTVTVTAKTEECKPYAFIELTPNSKATVTFA